MEEVTLIPVPSGQDLWLHEVIWNVPGTQGLTTRFRFIAPGLAGLTTDDALADMQALCTGFALDRISNQGPQPAQIIVSLADVVMPFGQTNPDAVQYFEAYRIENGACIWEIY
ncbi:MAG: DUF6497 family protein [Rhodobacteraceae bacterium]|jgi:Family of unknown function (DUF6497)|nr:DUF6497 family protein [Paracoccaceae bacterium]